MKNTLVKLRHLKIYKRHLQNKHVEIINHLKINFALRKHEHRNIKKHV